MALYEKQYLQWRKAHDAKVYEKVKLKRSCVLMCEQQLDRRREELLAEELAATFSPTFFTAAPVEGLDEQAVSVTSEQTTDL